MKRILLLALTLLISNGLCAITGQEAIEKLLAAPDKGAAYDNIINEGLRINSAVDMLRFGQTFDTLQRLGLLSSSIFSKQHPDLGKSLIKQAQAQLKETGKISFVLKDPSTQS
jgi:hypothetical protein